LGLLSPLACGNLIGLGEYKVVEDGADGSGGTTGSGGADGAGGALNKNCTDDASGVAVDRGCTAAKPMCDVGIDSCGVCVDNADCADDDACTLNVCGDGVCKSTVDANPADVILMDQGTLNGSLEDDVPNGSKNIFAVGWTQTARDDPCQGTNGLPLDCANNQNSEASCTAVTDCVWTDQAYYQTSLAYDCSGLGCAMTRPANGDNDVEIEVVTQEGSNLMWLGGLVYWSDSMISPEFKIPDGTKQLRVRADTNFITLESETYTVAYDTFVVELLNSSDEVVSEIADASNLDSQFVPAIDDNEDHNLWTTDGIQKDVNVPTGWWGQKLRLRVSSHNDGGSDTDFLVDNIRITATRVCD